ncbi:type I restriction enzyme, S subunit [Desulfomicrobium norvegicum]|uniref:Type I restriction enzyme, S subunit n=1 Tax=Desulfomicrobium norvegicum (strain DSM 1741 / NCIMB 8310) TaxID=52561 RepID=A0A8G2C448_DESNO|nr:type I restriction enzyme, S subunit [Desulfomicrobium norvegicum]
MNAVDACPKGYKQTEVGVIPEEWGVEMVGDAFEIRNQLRLPISQMVRKLACQDHVSIHAPARGATC